MTICFQCLSTRRSCRMTPSLPRQSSALSYYLAKGMFRKLCIETEPSRNQKLLPGLNNSLFSFSVIWKFLFCWQFYFQFFPFYKTASLVSFKTYFVQEWLKNLPQSWCHFLTILCFQYEDSVRTPIKLKSYLAIPFPAHYTYMYFFAP